MHYIQRNEGATALSSETRETRKRRLVALEESELGGTMQVSEQSDDKPRSSPTPDRRGPAHQRPGRKECAPQSDERKTVNLCFYIQGKYLSKMRKAESS